MKYFVLSAQIMLSACSTLGSSTLQASCDFENINHLYEVKKAKTDAFRDYIEGEIRFYSVFDKIEPSRPGFDLHIEKHRCIISFFRKSWFQFNVGGDIQYSCQDKKSIRKKALKYAEKYNIESLKLHTGLGDLCLNERSKSRKSEVH